MIRIRTLLGVAMIAIVTVVTGTAVAVERMPLENLGEGGLAIDGYDPVAYFVTGEATPGKPEHEVSYRGIRYRFSSLENQRLFLAGPDPYVPQYGGWCAFGFAMQPGQFGDWQPGPYPVDPESFLVQDGKLYLFHDAAGFDAREHWNADPARNRIVADEIWRRRVIEDKTARHAASSGIEGLNAFAPPQTAELAWFIGEWDVVWKMKSRPDAEEYDILTRATWKAMYTFDGFAIVDEFTAPSLSATEPWGDFRGMTFRAYDPEQSKWIMSYQHVNGSDAWRLEGTFADGRFAIEARSVVNDRLYRPVFYDITADGFSWKNDVSLDGGKTWIEDVAHARATRIR